MTMWKLKMAMMVMANTAAFFVGGTINVTFAQQESATQRDFAIERMVVQEGFDGNTCWVHARAGRIPSDESGNDSRHAIVVLTMQKLLLSGSDVFYAIHDMKTADQGAHWSAPQRRTAFARQQFPFSDDHDTSRDFRFENLVQVGDETTVCDFTPKWHAKSKKLLGIGHTVWYRDNHVMRVRPRSVAYAVYNQHEDEWSGWKRLQLPNTDEFANAGAGSVQRYDLPNGEVLLPIYFKKPNETQYSTTVCRCRFDGETMTYVEHGSELTVDVKRGLYEPSLTRLGDHFYLTMRNDDHGYVAVSRDGLHYDPPRRWAFDDGSVLGNYNTQQHWVTHSDGLFLVYTRRGAGNDHVFRHRAPLFIARVDPKTLQVVRNTERILVPERGARLGNFGVVDVSPSETWVTVTEWMQPNGVEQHGSNNRIYVAKLKWNRDNQLAKIEVDGTAHPTVWDGISQYVSPPKEWRDKYGDYQSPLLFADDTVAQTPADWQRRRTEILSQWHDMLGHWPPLITKPKIEVLESKRRENFEQLHIRFKWTPNEWTTGYLLIPDGTSPRPAVVTVYYEPETAIGLGKPYRDFAYQLARRGFVTLSIGTTDATAAKTYALYHPSIEDAKIQPLSMLAYAAANAWYLLAGRPEVDSSRIGIVGHSFGGKWTMFAACLFDEYACAAWSDPGIVFDESRPSVNYWEPWYLGYHPPPWRKRGVIKPDNPARGLYPQLIKRRRDLHELHALMAPRPFLVSGGSEDPPKRWTALNHTIAVNRVLGYTDRVAMTNRIEHAPNENSNAAIYAFFEYFLRPRPSGRN